MKTTKMSLSNMQGKLSRAAMKNVMGGLLAPPSCSGSCDWNWTDDKGDSHTTTGTCKTTEVGNLCYCSNGVGYCAG